MSSPKINFWLIFNKNVSTWFTLITADWSLGGLAIWINSGGRFDRDVDP